MSEIPSDVLYAYLRLGVAPDAPPEATAVLQQAEAYRYIGRERLKCVRRYAAFLLERQRLGGLGEPFAKIRRNYHKQAMALHPDRGEGGQEAVEELKGINAAYELVEAVQREAQQYFAQDVARREVTEAEARQERAREAPPGKAQAPRADPLRAKSETTQPKPAPRSNTLRYCAASVPRYIRHARLFYLAREAVIGSRTTTSAAGQSQLYDIIMLPEQEFIRARHHLSLAGGQTTSVQLSMSKITPAYMPMDTKQYAVPAGQANPWEVAREHFLKEFGLKQE